MKKTSTSIKDLPIGVFDSGVGGISVLRMLTALMPEEEYYYRGDSANAPYGTRPVSDICRLTLQNVEEMREYGIKCIVIACNTATSAAITKLRQTYTDIPVIGIEPALKPAALLKRHPSVIVMATPGTVAGNKFHDLLHQYDTNASVMPLPCPGLMEFVERGQLEGEEVEACLKELLLPCIRQAGKIDAVVLGCTHYPFLRKSIRKVIGEGPVILDGSEGTARETRRRLEAEGLLRTVENENGPRKRSPVIFSFTAPGMEQLAEKLLSEPA